MQRFGQVLWYAGLAAMIVGGLGLLSMLVQWLGVAFVFPVSPWYGPFLGGALLAAVGWALKRSGTRGGRGGS